MIGGCYRPFVDLNICYLVQVLWHATQNFETFISNTHEE